MRTQGRETLRQDRETLCARVIFLGNMSSPDLVDRRARRCVAGYAEDEDEDDIDDTIFSDSDCNAFTVQRSSGSGDFCEEKDLQSCWQRRRCFDGCSPLDELVFSDDDELFGAVDSIIIRRGARRDDDDQPAYASDNGHNETFNMILRRRLQSEIVGSGSIATCAPNVHFAQKKCELTRVASSPSITSIISIDLNTGDERYGPKQRAWIE